MPSHKLLSSKLTIVVLVVLLAMFGQLKYKQWQSQRAIELEKENLSKQEQALEQRKQELSESLSFFNSQDFKEKIARQQLNLKKNGEVVYTFSQGGQEGQVAGEPEPENVSNPQKWWSYFFGK